MKTNTRSTITMLVIFILSLTFVTPVAAKPATTDLGVFTANATHPWPATSPYSAAVAVEMVSCQTSVGVYDPQANTRWFDVSTQAFYEAMTRLCITGVAWFKDGAPMGTIFQNADALTGGPVGQPAIGNTTAGSCGTLASRNERLDCATKVYFDAGQGLNGIEAYFHSLGITWDELKVGDPFQPDAVALTNGSPRIWGALVKGRNVKVVGNACLVSDVPSRITNWGWVFMDDRYAPHPSVGHYGNATSANELVELAVHADCSDWPEIVSAMSNPGVEYRPYGGANGSNGSTNGSNNGQHDTGGDSSSGPTAMKFSSWLGGVGNWFSAAVDGMIFFLPAWVYFSWWEFLPLSGYSDGKTPRRWP